MIPPEQSGESGALWAWHMEDVLEVYTRPSDSQWRVICMAQRAPQVNKQVLCEVREPLPMRPDQVRREDYEYVRGGA